jgi:hypothetical protein
LPLSFRFLVVIPQRSGKSAVAFAAAVAFAVACPSVLIPEGICGCSPLQLVTVNCF